MSMALLLGASSLVYTWKPEQSLESLRTAAVFGCLHWITGISAVFYPGPKAIDPEFAEKYGDGSPQLYVFGGLMMLSLLGYWLESTQMVKMGRKTA